MHDSSRPIEVEAYTAPRMVADVLGLTGPWRYERLGHLGHWMQLEAPGTVNTLLLDFLNRHRPLTTAMSSHDQ